MIIIQYPIAMGLYALFGMRVWEAGGRGVGLWWMACSPPSFKIWKYQISLSIVYVKQTQVLETKGWKTQSNFCLYRFKVIANFVY